jgi:hypothetical protein
VVKEEAPLPRVGGGTFVRQVDLAVEVVANQLADDRGTPSFADAFPQLVP